MSKEMMSPVRVQYQDLPAGLLCKYLTNLWQLQVVNVSWYHFSLLLWRECIAEIISSLFFHSKAWGEIRFLKFISSRSQLDWWYFEFENDKT